MTFSTAGTLILASEAEVAVDERVLEEEAKSVPEIRTVTEAPAPVTEVPVTEASTMETPAAETLVTEASAIETPITEMPVTEAPTTETSVPEATPETETLATEAPTTESPVTETPTTEAPVTETPETETPETETPKTETPVTETTTETPATEGETTDAPTEPQTETPKTEPEKVEYSVTFDSHAADYGKIVVESRPEDVATYKKKVAEKESFTFSVVPNEGYETEYVRVDGIDVPKTEQQGEYRLAAVEKDTVITVTYRKTPETANTVTFQISEGAAIFAQDGAQITSTATAKNSKIVFSIIAEEGYTVTEVLVDGHTPARHTDDPNEYIIEGISTDETVVTVSTALVEAEDEGSSETEERKVQVNGGEEQRDVDVRASADGLSEILFTLPHGAFVTVLGAEGDWLKIEYEGQVGYVYRTSVFTDGAEAPEEPEAEKAQPKAIIFSSRSAVMEPGETVTLTSRLENADGYEIRYQWECDRGAGFEAVEGANSDTYAFKADTQTLSYNWRLVVYYR